MPKKYDNIEPLDIPRKPPREGGDRNRFDGVRPVEIPPKNLSPLRDSKYSLIQPLEIPRISRSVDAERNKFDGLEMIEIAAMPPSPDGVLNKFLRLPPIPGSGPQAYRVVQGTLDMGIVLSVSPQDLELNQSPDLDCVRVEQGGLRQEHDLTELGSAAALSILSLGQHSFVLTGNEIFDRFFRVFRQVNRFIRIESWDDLTWGIEFDADDTVVDSVLLSFKSFFGSAYFADGSRVIEWKQSTSLVPREDDFPTSSNLTAEGNTVSAVIIPAAAYLGKYKVNYSLVITGPCASGSSVDISIEDDASVELAVINHPIPVSTSTSRVFTLTREIAEAVDVIASGEDLTLKLKTITAVPHIVTDTMSLIGGTPQFQVTKSRTREAQGDSYTFDFGLNDSETGNGTFVEFYYDTGGGWVLWNSSIEYFNTGGRHQRTLVQAGLGSGDKFGIHIISGDQGTFSIPTSPAPFVDWGDAFDEDVVVHGFNQSDDSEDGVTYDIEGTPTNDLNEMDKNPNVTPTHSGTATSGGVKTLTDTGAAFTAGDIGRYLKIVSGLGALQLPKKITAQTSTQLTIGEDWTVQPDNTSDYEVYTPELLVARYLGVFDDRLIGLQIDGDPQTVGWSRSGLLNDWVGAGSGELILRSDSDPVDELMAYERISTGVAALFRVRSIMRSTPTGSDAQALGFRKWIENLGTESPHSVTVVPGGVIFLGHDRQVYFLNESGPQALSQFIQEELEQTIGDLGIVEGAYDPDSQNFILAVPGPSGSNTVTSWILDFGRLQSESVSTWFRRAEVMNRLAIVEGRNLVFAGADNIVREYNTDAVCGGYWISPMLNRDERETEFDLSTVTIRYEAEANTTILIEGSGDGGKTWVVGRKPTVDLIATTNELRRAIQSFEVSGYDTRFRLTFPTDQKVVIKSWRADLVVRGGSRSE